MSVRSQFALLCLLLSAISALIVSIHDVPGGEQTVISGIQLRISHDMMKFFQNFLDFNQNDTRN